MFNWICPECGRDVPPSESECRFCAERRKAAGVAAPPVDPTPAYSAPPPAQPYSQPLPPMPSAQQPAPAGQPAMQQPAPLYAEQSYPPSAPPQYYSPPAQPQQPPYAQPPYTQPPYGQQMPGPSGPSQPPDASGGSNRLFGAPAQAPAPQPSVGQPYYQQGLYPPPKRGLPTWALSLLFAVAFIGLGAAIFFGYQYFGRAPRAERAGVTEPAASARSKPANALQKYIEVVGIRLVQDARHRPQARFIVVNHSSAELNELTANVTLYASTSRSEEDSVGTFSFKLDSIAGNESKELTEPFNTKLKIYELPDWQNATADVQIAQP